MFWFYPARADHSVETIFEIYWIDKRGLQRFCWNNSNNEIRIITCSLLKLSPEKFKETQAKGITKSKQHLVQWVKDFKRNVFYVSLHTNSSKCVHITKKSQTHYCLLYQNISVYSLKTYFVSCIKYWALSLPSSPFSLPLPFCLYHKPNIKVHLKS